MLRGQTNELEQENGRLRADTGSTQAAGDLLSHRFVPLSGLAFAGYTTPEAALESVLWAERETNINAYLTSLVPDTQQAEQERLQTQFDRGVAQPFFHDGNFVTGFQVVETNGLSDDRVAVTFYVGGNNQTIKLVAKKIGNEWKLHAGPTF